MPRGSGSGAPKNIYTPADERPKVERSSEDNRDYVVGGEGSYLEETHQHFVLMIDPETGVGSPALIAMKSTQLKKSRKFNSMVASRVMKGKNGQFTPPLKKTVKVHGMVGRFLLTVSSAKRVCTNKPRFFQSRL